MKRFLSTDVNECDWRGALEKWDGATIYHTPEWKRLLESVFGYKSCYLFAVDETGIVEGLLPLFQIKSRITGERLCSVPFSHICGPIGDKDSRHALIEGAVDLYRESGTSHLEIRSSIEREGFANENHFSTYILELSSDIEQVWRKLDKRSVRWSVKRSKKFDLKVDETKDKEDLEALYELNCITKREKGVPCHPWSFFQKLFEFFGNQVSLYTVRNGNHEIIAGGVMTYFKNTAIYGYGAADPDHLNSHPYHAFMWKAIEDAGLNGYKYFDFGRVSYDNAGLISFKKRWGTEEQRLHYSFYPRNPGLIMEKRGNLKYRFATRIIQKMPIPIYKRFSDGVFGGFG